MGTGGRETRGKRDEALFEAVSRGWNRFGAECGDGCGAEECGGAGIADCGVAAGVQPTAAAAWQLAGVPGRAGRRCGCGFGAETQAEGSAGRGHYPHRSRCASGTEGAARERRGAQGERPGRGGRGAVRPHDARDPGRAHRNPGHQPRRRRADPRHPVGQPPRHGARRVEPAGHRERCRAREPRHGCLCRRGRQRPARHVSHAHLRQHAERGRDGGASDRADGRVPGRAQRADGQAGGAQERGGDSRG